MCGLKLNERIDKIEAEVNKEIQDVMDGKSVKNINQLVGIVEELRKMKNEECLNINYTRFIIDSWDYSDSLGIELLDLAESYKKIVKGK
ncbi:hypothetical protein [Pseudobutyrivibrio xylanivorans]|uniref:Uncharacterized protein n=1 Tax=Pseudobutyrivibrio xylanivorans DSM 14809 TaxID=1123012 RepID=A0A1M6J828_PSEXY|nr:hypothetical protein [Pseudobutyrivibrio xylanivorans]SHJ42838.1 hypothetical protein SAMN02745725_02532 [Pseudobutyrivibrio xylanivorans DSM 14809]